MSRDRQRERASADAREKQLLDRLTAPDFATYKAYSAETRLMAPVRQLLTDEAEADYEREQELLRESA